LLGNRLVDVDIWRWSPWRPRSSVRPLGGTSRRHSGARSRSERSRSARRADRKPHPSL